MTDENATGRARGAGRSSQLPVAEAASGVWGPRYRRLTLGLLLIGLGIGFKALAVAATLPVTVAEIGGLALYGWAFSAFMLVNLIGITIAGYEADRRGPRGPFLGGAVSFVAGLLIAGAAPSMPVLILGRAVQGLGAGLLYALALYSLRGAEQAWPAPRVPFLPRTWRQASAPRSAPGLTSASIVFRSSARSRSLKP